MGSSLLTSRRREFARNIDFHFIVSASERTYTFCILVYCTAYTGIVLFNSFMSCCRSLHIYTKMLSIGYNNERQNYRNWFSKARITKSNDSLFKTEITEPDHFGLALIPCNSSRVKKHFVYATDYTCSNCNCCISAR